MWWRPVCILAISYALQWIGHRIDGTEMGEVILIRKLRTKFDNHFARSERSVGDNRKARPRRFRTT